MYNFLTVIARLSSGGQRIFWTPELEGTRWSASVRILRGNFPICYRKVRRSNWTQPLHVPPSWPGRDSTPALISSAPWFVLWVSHGVFIYFVDMFFFSDVSHRYPIYI